MISEAGIAMTDAACLFDDGEGAFAGSAARIGATGERRIHPAKSAPSTLRSRARLLYFQSMGNRADFVVFNNPSFPLFQCAEIMRLRQRSARKRMIFSNRDFFMNVSVIVRPVMKGRRPHPVG